MQTPLETLKNLVTDERYNRFQQVIQARTRHVQVAIEDVWQAHNASAVLRSCDCFGIQNVHIIESKNEFRVNQDIALGASKWLSIERYGETKRALECLKKQGLRIVATTPHSKVALHELKLTQPTVLVFGTEQEGVSSTVWDMSDEQVKIPMYGFTESFNISVAAGITLYTLRRMLEEQFISWQLTVDEQEELMRQWLEEKLDSKRESIKY